MLLALALLTAQASPAVSPAPPTADRGLACEFAVIGGGAGGVYAAWRLATAAERPVRPQDICVFERLPHVGGRTYTLHDQGPRHDLQVDLGATVFCDCLPVSDACGHCNGMQTPLMKGVIQQALKLPTARYRYPSFNGTDYKGCGKIVSAAGSRENRGFASYIEGMANASAALGVRYYFNHELEELEAALLRCHVIDAQVRERRERRRAVGAAQLAGAAAQQAHAPLSITAAAPGAIGIWRRVPSCASRLSALQTAASL